MDKIEHRPVDLAPFRAMPLLTTRGSMSIARALVDGAPPGLPAYVDASRVRLIQRLERADKAMTARRKTTDNPKLERSFDLLVDHIWATLRGGLEFWRIYGHVGIGLFDADEQLELELEHKRELAEQAEDLLEHLFGDGLSFLRLSYPEQAEHMAERLRYIDDEGLSEVFVELVGEHSAALVRACQRRYEVMVRNRHQRKAGVRVNLRTVRESVRAAAEDYANLLLSTLHDADAERSAAVFAALEPMRSPRATLARAAEVDEELAAELDDSGDSDAEDLDDEGLDDSGDLGDEGLDVEAGAEAV